ncbi:MAG: hydroxysqualene dehydroxylase, partial [Gaiellaceae bacterium]
MKAGVVGGGLGGLAAALELVQAGHDVTLYEARPSLGGAVQTLPEREGDPTPPPDNGQHIALGCCTEYLAFLGVIGEAASVVRTPLSLPVIDPDGRVAKIAPGALALLRYRHLTPRDRLGVARVARALGKLDPEQHDSEAFATLLRRLGSSQEAVDGFWDVFIRPALNIRSEEASAALGLFTVQTALLGEPGASDLILPRKPLGEMHGEAAGRVLEARGAAVQLRQRVASLDEIEADGVVLAVPPDESARLLDEPDPGLEDSPIVSVHLLFDRRLLEPPLAALLGSPAHWVFDRGRLTGSESGRGQY